MTEDFTLELSVEEQAEYMRALASIQRLGAYTVMEWDDEVKEWLIASDTVRGLENARKKLQEYKATFRRNHVPALQVVPKNMADFIRNFYKTKRPRSKRSEPLGIPGGMYMPDNL